MIALIARIFTPRIHFLPPNQPCQNTLGEFGASKTQKLNISFGFVLKENNFHLEVLKLSVFTVLLSVSRGAWVTEVIMWFWSWSDTDCALALMPTTSLTCTNAVRMHLSDHWKAGAVMRITALHKFHLYCSVLKTKHKRALYTAGHSGVFNGALGDATQRFLARLNVASKSA